jgi:hypothetical protein
MLVSSNALLIGSHMVRTTSCMFHFVILSVIKELSLIKCILYVKKQDTVIDASMELWVLSVRSLL